MPQFHVLHLTDLHLEADPSWEQKVLLDALIEDLKKLRVTQTAPSLVLFTGDLAVEADAPGAYDSVLNYLLSVVDALGLDETRLITCPGNHDAKRSTVAPKIPLLKKWRASARTITGANDLIADPVFRTYVQEAFDPYRSIAGEFGKTSEISRGPYSATHFVRDLGVTVVAVNTALLTGTGVSTDVADRGELCLPERALIEALDAGPKGVPALVIGHHPPSWFNDASTTLVETVLAQRAIAYFSGHMHETSPRQIRSISGTLLHVDSGALHTERERWNGYALVSLDTETGHSRTSYRRWFEKRRQFAKAEDIGTDGTFHSSEDASIFWEARTSSIDPVTLSHWRANQLAEALAAECNEGFSDQALDTVFVPPDFEYEVPYGKEADGRVGSRMETLTFEQVTNNAENYIISARTETGKSTALKQIALSMSRNSERTGSGSIPVYLQFNSIKSYVAQIENMIRQKLPELPANYSVKRFLSEGYLTLLVDDVDFTREEQRRALVSFVAAHPKCRYIFASSTAFVESSALKPEITPTVPFTRIVMRSFRQAQLLTLIENHGTTDPLKADQLLERVVRDASALNVPLTAVTGTFLIQILREDPDHLVLNQAAFIERYLEMVLQKYAPKELLPGTFDFTNKVDLLCAVAEHMVRSDEYAPDENTVLTWCISYLKGYGLAFSARDLLTYFVQARVLERDGDCIRFRLRMFFEFFVAKRMIDDASFRDHIFDDENYLHFVNEIGFYAAINRRDRSQLERIMGKFRVLGESVWSAENGVPNEEEYLRTFKIPGKDTSIDELRRIEQEIRSPEQIKMDREEFLDGAELRNDQSQEISRPIYLTEEEKWVSHLILLSGMLKHMELIPDWDKRKFLSEVLQGWVRFAVNSLGAISALVTERRVKFNGITYRSTLPDNLPAGEVGRRLALSMPSAAARMATMFLGTEKLRLQLEDGLGEQSEPPGRQFMRVAILADLGVESIAGPAAKASTALKDHRFLQLALARKLYEAAVRFRLPERELIKLRTLVSEIHVALEGVPGKGVARRKAEIITGMSRQRLQIEYRPGEKRRDRH